MRFFSHFLPFHLSITLPSFPFSIPLIHFRFENDAGNLKKWQHFRRELVNLSTLFVPWQLRIKEIESHFGSVVASYFTFLRWLFWVNIVLAFTLSTFVILPEVGMTFFFCSVAITFVFLSLWNLMLMKLPSLSGHFHWTHHSFLIKLFTFFHVHATTWKHIVSCVTVCWPDWSSKSYVGLWANECHKTEDIFKFWRLSQVFATVLWVSS